MCPICFLYEQNGEDPSLIRAFGAQGSMDMFTFIAYLFWEWFINVTNLSTVHCDRAQNGHFYYFLGNTQQWSAHTLRQLLTDGVESHPHFNSAPFPLRANVTIVTSHWEPWSWHQHFRCHRLASCGRRDGSRKTEKPVPLRLQGMLGVIWPRRSRSQGKRWSQERLSARWRCHLWMAGPAWLTSPEDPDHSSVCFSLLVWHMSGVSDEAEG